MSALLPRKPAVERPKSDPEVVTLDDGAGDIIGVLSSKTTRKILLQLHHEPRTPSALAETLGISIQNTAYHLEKLHSNGLVEVIETWYSEKGQRMAVYAPAANPLVLVIGDPPVEVT